MASPISPLCVGYLVVCIGQRLTPLSLLLPNLPSLSRWLTFFSGLFTLSLVFSRFLFVRPRPFSAMALFRALAAVNVNSLRLAFRQADIK